MIELAGKDEKKHQNRRESKRAVGEIEFGCILFTMYLSFEFINYNGNNNNAGRKGPSDELFFFILKYG